MSAEAEFPDTVPGLLRRAAATCQGRGVVFVDEDQRRYSWTEIEEQASRVAAGLQALGATPGDRVALLSHGLRPLVAGFFGAVLAGLQPTILPAPVSRRRLGGYVRHTGGIVAVAAPRFLLVDRPVAEVAEPLVAAAGLRGRTRIDGLEGLLASRGRFDAPPVGPDDVAVIQFTSGSTSAPRGVVLPHRCVAANVRAIVEHLEVGDGDVGGGWLPLYHDMGLIGNLLGATARAIELVLTTPFNFLRRPRRWLEIMERHRVSITAGPNVSYRHLLERGEPAGDLSAWRVAIVGAEPIDPDLLDAFSECFAPVGFRREAFMPAYGLAEVGLMVTGVPAREPYRAVCLSRQALEREGRAVPAADGAAAVRIVGVGIAVRDTQVRIVGARGEPLEDGRVGEIVVSGASVMRGYFNDPPATAEALRDGWLYTGDLGYKEAGELFVTGRKKELIIIQGRNYYPQDIERLVQDLEEVRPGSVVAFGTNSGFQEGVVVVAAPRDPGAKRELEARIRELVAESLNLPVLDVVLVESGRVPRTTSGKLCRGRCRELYERGALP